MPPKRSKSKISFKIFSSENYSKFANRFPFLEERQIKAKLLQAWRNRFTTETKKAKSELEIPEHRNEASFKEVKRDTTAASQEDAFDKPPKCSPLKTYMYANRRYNNGKQNKTGSAADGKLKSKSVCVSGASKMDNSKALKEPHTGTERNAQNGLIDLFGEINAEQLLIEPGDIFDADSEFITSATGHFNHKEWLQKLDKKVCNEKKSNTVSGMFKWRADKKMKTSEKNEDKNSYDSRFLVSNESEGCSNFCSMFAEEEDIFL